MTIKFSCPSLCWLMIVIGDKIELFCLKSSFQPFQSAIKSLSSEGERNPSCQSTSEPISASGGETLICGVQHLSAVQWVSSDNSNNILLNCFPSTVYTLLCFYVFILLDRKTTNQNMFSCLSLTKMYRSTVYCKHFTLLYTDTLK